MGEPPDAVKEGAASGTSILAKEYAEKLQQN